MDTKDTKKIKEEILDSLENKKKYWILEYNALDDRIDLYEWETDKEDETEICEEIEEEMHNYSNFLLMNKEKFENLKKEIKRLN